MRFESEVLTEDLLPAIRSIMASRLDQEFGLNQYEIAELLNLTQPAVSQYLNNKRAGKKLKDNLKDDPQIDLLLKEAADNAAAEEDFSEEIENVVTAVRDKGILKQEFKQAERIL